MRPAIYQLLGYPGTGKYTTALELVRQLEAVGQPARLLDSHRTANILFDLIIEADGSTPLPDGIYPRVREMNMAVVRTIEELSPREWSFVFTHHLVDQPVNRHYLDELRRVAAARDNDFVPVVLTCELDELANRIPAPERAARQKLTDPTRLADFVDGGMLMPDDALVLDVTTSTPTETARRIIAEGVRLP